MKAQITLRSGAQIEAEVEDLTTTRNRLTNELTGLEWTSVDCWQRKLHTIEVSEIVAIVLIREPAEATVDGGQS
ncbi:hypothetical protein [Catelliglobosispora koreensis]|uniref:hypothetical protein n=1 Tax=Catelliglobosispora koreensis TaxID=129052 RepID=UPI000369CA7A|nr:hypothetical protein [Catelliglobosispora koreensis]